MITLLPFAFLLMSQIQRKRSCKKLNEMLAMRCGFNGLSIIRGAVVAQSPGIHIARLAGLHADDDVTVPGPRVITIVLAGAGWMIRVRMIPANQLEILCARGLFGEADVFGRDFEAIPRRVVATIGERHQIQHFAGGFTVTARIAPQHSCG